MSVGEVGARGGSRRLSSGIAAGALVLSVLFRLTTWGDVFRTGIVRVPPFDDQYHALRVVHSALHFPEVLDFDPERGFSGGYCPWPPLYDLAAGGLARLLGGRTDAEVLARAVWFPVATQSFFLVALAFFVVRRLGAFAGGTTALALVLSLPLVWISRLGSIDHHFLEAPLLLGLAAALFGAVRARSRRDLVRGGLGLALALSASLFVESAFLFAAALGFLGLFLFAARERVPLLTGALGFGLAAAAVAAYRATRSSDSPEGEWFLGTPHAAALGAAGLALLALAVLRARGGGPFVSGALALALGSAAAAAVPGTLAAYGDGARYFGGDRWLSTIRELSPLVLRSATPLRDLLWLGGGSVLVFFFAANAWRERSAPRGVVALVAMGYLLASLSSRRLLLAACALLTVAGGSVLASWWRAGRRTAFLAGAAAMVIPALAGGWVEFRRPWPFEPPETPAFERVARYLVFRADAPGRVLGPWPWGHLLHRLGRRPVIVDNFGAMLGRSAFDEALGTFLSTREERVARWCGENGVRFIVLENPLAQITPLAQTVGFPPSAFLRPGPADAPTAVTRLAQTTFWWRAYFDRGAARPEAGRRGEAFRHFRLVYEDLQPSADPPPYRGPAAQVWELVVRP